MILCVAVIFLISATVMWLRSYDVTDCWIRSTDWRTDSLYFSRGMAVLNLHTTVAEPVWSHMRGLPVDFPRSMAESGDLISFGALGLEYSAASEMLIVPLWMIAAVAAGILVLMWRYLRRHSNAAAADLALKRNAILPRMGTDGHR